MRFQTSIELSFTEVDLFVLSRVFVSKECRHKISKELNKIHQSVSETLQNDRQRVNWHGIT